MKANEQRSFHTEGLDPARGAEFRAADGAARAWQAAHPWTLAEYLSFLDSFLPLSSVERAQRPPTYGTDFRL